MRKPLIDEVCPCCGGEWRQAKRSGIYADLRCAVGHEWAVVAQQAAQP